jgi:hypothetical protein
LEYLALQGIIQLVRTEPPATVWTEVTYEPGTTPPRTRGSDHEHATSTGPFVAKSEVWALATRELSNTLMPSELSNVSSAPRFNVFLTTLVVQTRLFNGPDMISGGYSVRLTVNRNPTSVSS